MRGISLQPGAVELRRSSHHCLTRRRGLGGYVSEWVVCMLPICNTCFRRLPEEEKLRHFRDLWLESDPGPQHLGEWAEIVAAVLAEI